MTLTPEEGKSSIFKSENFNPSQISQFWAKLKNQFFGKKKHLVKFFEKIFCPSDAECFPDSKMILLFEFCPKIG